jgi:hypothetical protein
MTTAVQNTLIFAGAALGGYCLFRRYRQSRSLDDITQQIQQARGMSAPAARKYLRSEAKNLRREVIPALQQDARDLDSRARSWRSARGQAGGRARGAKWSGWWSDIRRAAEYNEVPVERHDPREGNVEIETDPRVLLCAARKAARPGKLPRKFSSSILKPGVSPTDWFSQLLTENPDIYADCAREVDKDEEPWFVAAE